MDTTQLAIVIGVVAAIVVVAIVVLAVRVSRRRRERAELRDRYGPEYERTVAELGSAKAATADIRAREGAHDEVRLRDLDPHELDDLRARLATAQYDFVEDPDQALHEVGRIAVDAVGYRGYPLHSGSEQALRHLALDHPRAAQAVRRVIEAPAEQDDDSRRRALLDVRDALREICGVTYSAADVGRRTVVLDDADVDAQGQGQRELASAGPADSKVRRLPAPPASR